MQCRGTIWQHFAGGFLGTMIAVLIFSFFTRDMTIVFGACTLFGTIGWFHPQIYAAAVTAKPQIAGSWTAFRERETPIEQKLARLRKVAMTLVLLSAFSLTMFAGSKVDGLLSPWGPVAAWALCMSTYSPLFNYEWTGGPYAQTNKETELSQYARGRIYFFLRKLVELVWIGSVFSGIVVVQLFYYGLLVAFAIFTVLAVSGVRLVRMVLYYTAKYAEAGICVTTALAVTAWTTSTYLPSSAEPVRALCIALLAGFLAGAASVVISKGIVIFFESDDERKRLATSAPFTTVTEDYAPQYVHVLNIGWLFFSGMSRLVKRALPSEPRMQPMTTRFIPSLIIG